MDLQKLGYAFDGLIRRSSQTRICPSCTSEDSRRIDRKGFHELRRCDDCGLMYRWPYETQEQMAHFYQSGYQQAGLTTDLPDTQTLRALMDAGFKGSQKDFSHLVHLLELLALPSGARILDFGANWGYGVWQLNQAGFACVGYELSKPRADFSRNLGVQVFTEWSEIEQRAPYAVVFSSHVLEHTPDPAEALHRKLSVLAPGGLLIALFPNGSDAFRHEDPKAFHRLWGRVHPVLLNECFIRHTIPDSALFIGALCPKDFEVLKDWDKTTTRTGTLSRSEMMIVLANRNANGGAGAHL